MTKKACADAVDRLYPYLDGEMTTVQRWKVRWHLRKCPPCEGAYVFEERLKVVVRERLHEDCPDELVDRLRGLIREEHPDH